MTIEDAPPSSRRARREARAAPAAAPAGAARTAGDGADSTASTDGSARVAPASGHLALGWLADDDVTARSAPRHLAGASNPYTVASVDLLARRPRRSPLRPGVVLPFLGAVALVGAYAVSYTHLTLPTIYSV